MARLKSLAPRLLTQGNRLTTLAARSWRTDKQTSSQRGYGYKWQVARAAYLEAHPFCIYCLRRAGITETERAAVVLACAAAGIALPMASVVDHRIPHRGDKQLFWDSANWQGLCRPCHDIVKKKEEQYM